MVPSPCICHWYIELFIQENKYLAEVLDIAACFAAEKGVFFRMLIVKLIW